MTPPDPTLSHDPDHATTGPIITSLTASGAPDPDDTQNRAPGDAIAAPVEAIPGYELLAELGRGGMAVVHKARQVKLNRIVALKTMLRADAVSRARFLAEAEAIAAIAHPHVVQVFEFGEHDGTPYLAMEYVTGGSLAEFLASGKSPSRSASDDVRGPFAGAPARTARSLAPSDAAALLEKIASGVAAAHDLGIVHRDLKPANVLLDANGAPKVSDFGLAKRAAGSDLTHTQAIMGTPAYMAPEQAKGAKFAGPPADVWALGVILYECLTGKRPFTGEDVEQILNAVLNDNPVPVGTLAARVPRDLVTILGKCLCKDPLDRYPTAKELTQDLGRFGRGDSIQARPLGRVEQAVRWMRRKPTAAAAWGFSALAVLLAIVALLVVGLWRDAEGAKLSAEIARDELADANAQLELATTSAQTERDAARRTRDELADTNGQLELARTELEQERRKVEILSYAHAIPLAHREYQASDVVKARMRLERCPISLRNWEWHYLYRLCHQEQATFDTGWGCVNAVSWGPTGLIATTGQGSVAQVWDPTTGQQRARIVPSTWAAVWSPDGKRLAVDRGTSACICDPNTGKVLMEFEGHTKMVRSIAWAPNGRRIATAAMDDTIRIWDVRSGEQLARYRIKDVDKLAWGVTGKLAVLSSWRLCWILDPATGERLTELKGHSDHIAQVAWSPDGERVATASWDKTARVWDSDSGEELLVFSGHSRALTAVAWSPDGTTIASADEKQVRFWNPTTGKEVAAPCEQAQRITALDWSPTGNRIVTGSFVHAAHVWNVSATSDFEVLSPDRIDGPHAGVWAPDGRLATWSRGGTVRIWNPDTRQSLIELKSGETHPVAAAVWSRDGRKLLSAGRDKTLRIWDASDGTQLLRLDTQLDSVVALDWSPDGKQAIIGGHKDDSARIWNLEGKTRTLSLTGHRRGILSAAWSPDGKRIATGGGDGTARIWDAASGTELLCMKFSEFDDVAHMVFGVAWSPDGKWLATGAQEKDVSIWDTTTGKRVALLETSSLWINSVAWNSDGSRLIVAPTLQGPISIWDPVNRHELLVLPGEGFAAFSPDGSKVATRHPVRASVVLYQTRVSKGSSPAVSPKAK